MYIIQSNLSDDELDKANDRIVEEIEKRGGAILHRERLGRKRLAYPIRRSDDGAYHLLYFELPPGEVSGLRLAYKLHPRLLRMLILRKEREEIAKLQARRRPGDGPAEGEAVEASTDSAGDDADGTAEPAADDESVLETGDEEPMTESDDEDESEKQE